MKTLPIGNCPYCDSEQGKYGGWAGSDEMFAEYKKQHEAGHPEFERKPMTIQQEEQVTETWKYDLGKALKSLGLGMSGSQADFIFEHVQHLMDVAYKQGKGDVASQRKQVKEEVKANIGWLRTWLNEDRITDPKKLVTNKQIEKWLFDALKKI